jgi:hypothetical protein
MPNLERVMMGKKFICISWGFLADFNFRGSVCISTSTSTPYSASRLIHKLNIWRCIPFVAVAPTVNVDFVDMLTTPRLTSSVPLSLFSFLFVFLFVLSIPLSYLCFFSLHILILISNFVSLFFPQLQQGRDP